MSTLNTAGTQTFTGAAAADPRLGGVRGKVEQYGQNNRGNSAFDPTKIIPADGSRVGTKGGNANIKGTTPPGGTAIRQDDPTLQNATDAMVIGQLAVPAKGQQGTAVDADNFLASTVTGVPASTVGQGSAAYGTVAVNAAQAASAGKSLAAEHE